MAQKETSSKSRRWLGLSGAAVLVANLVLTGTTIAFQQEGEVNHALGIEGAGASYGGTEFSADGTLSDASYEKYIEAAYQFCEQEEEEGSVLLYNRNNALPLSESERNVTVFGRGSIDPVFRSTAGGSSTNPDYQKTPVDALQDAGFNVNQTVLDAYASAEAPKERSVSSVGEYDPALFTGSVTDSFASYGDVAFVTLSRFATEGNDLAMVNDKGKRMLELDDNEKAIFQQIKDSGKFKKTVVLLNSVFAMEMDWLDEYNVDAVLWVGNPGFYGMPGAIRVVTGEVNPSGHTTATFAANSLSAPSAENFGLHAYNYGSKTPRAAGDSFVSYNEGIYVGYRYYETKAYDEADFGNDDWYKENVVYPFDYGLSYTTFDWKIADSTDNSVDLTADGEIQVQVKVTNTGSVAGKDVVQLYYTAPYKAGQIEKSYVALGAYEKTELLQPGESDIVMLSLPVESMASYDYDDANHNGHKGYEVEGGNYAIRIGRNAHQCWNDNPLRITYHVPADGFFYDAGVTEGSTVENRFDYISEHFVDEETGVSTLMTREDFRGKTIAAPTAEEREVDADFIQSMTFTYDDENEPYYTEQTYQQGVTADKYIQLYELLQKNEDGKWAADYDDPRWETILDYLTVDKMANMIGTGNFNTAKIDRIGKPATIDPDGPAGFTNFMGDPSVHDTCFYVSECVVGATWNKQLAHDMGVMIGIEGLVGYTNGDGRTYSGWYAPAVNIHRSPFSGRNWEYYSEDPLLTGLMGASVVQGANSKGVYTYVKHFVLNDQETNRDANGLVTWADEQTMREIYLKPFEIIVKQADTKGIMSSFNRIGNVWTGGSYTLLTDVLRKEWGFVGMVITDYSVQNAYMPPNQMIRAGGDLYLTQGYLPSTTGSTVNSTHLAAMRQAVKNILYVVTNSNAMNGKGEGIVYRYAMPYWQIGLIALNVVMWLLVVLIGVIRIRKTKKKHPIQ